MKVDSQNIEFGYELIAVIPYAYFQHIHGRLKQTRSGNDTESLYYFSKRHEINRNIRSWDNMKRAFFPNITIHKPFIDKMQWRVPPYKQHFANDEFKWEKETVVICNRHNIEWGVKAINFFDLDTLAKLLDMLQDRYQVVYINVEGKKELYDGAAPQPLGDFDLLKQYPKVINFHDLCEGKSWNETQLKVFANCEKYITMNGGHAILAAYFGGENIVMSKPYKVHSRELLPEVNSFYSFYHEFNNQRVVLVNNSEELLSRVKLQWIDNEPVCNILVRTSNRPNFFADCMESILKQTYKNIAVYVSIDGNESYHVPYPVYPVKVRKQSIAPVTKQNYGKPFPSNLYLNELKKKVTSGAIMYIDDDDMLLSPTSVETIMREYKKGYDLLFWKCRFNERIIPGSDNWKKKPVARDISGIGFAFDSKLDVVWEPYKLGDYRVASWLWNNARKKKFIDKILTGIQANPGYGKRLDKPASLCRKKKIRMINPAKGCKYPKDTVIELHDFVAEKYTVLDHAVYV